MIEPTTPRDGRPDPDDPLTFEERAGRYVLGLPLVRAARERPDVAAPWLVLGLAVLVTWLATDQPGLVLLVLLVGLPTIFFARILASGRRRRGSSGDSPIRLALILVWVLITLGAMFAVATVDIAVGATGLVRVVGFGVVLLAAAAALRWIFRA